MQNEDIEALGGVFLPPVSYTLIQRKKGQSAWAVITHVGGYKPRNLRAERRYSLGKPGVVD